ncbi:MAG: transposase [Flavobacteriales bacterium Tduv]
MIPWEGMETEIRKIYQKVQRLKGQTAYSGISLFKMILLSNWYDLTYVGTEELMKEYLSYMRLCYLPIGR